MINRRPSPAVIAARKYEVARRYSRKAKTGKRSRSMAAIRLSQLMRICHDRYGDGTELPSGQDSYGFVRVVAHHLGALPDAPRRITSWISVYSPWIMPVDRERLINEVVSCPLKWSADKLAWKLKLSDSDRSRLKITTIGAYDVTKEQRKDRDKAKRADRERNRRATLKAARVPSI